MLNVLRGLLPQYERQEGALASSMAASRVGSARAFLDKQEQRAGLWTNPLANIVSKAGKVRVRDLVRPFGDGETVDEEDSLDIALNQMVVGRYQSLLVTRDGEITGILRLTDVYEAISHLLRNEGVERT
jgi:CBS domain containing-hemolysin-like protein